MNMFAKELKSLRLRKKMTQEQFSRAWKVDRWSISQYENGNMLPGLTRIHKLNAVFGVDASPWVMKAHETMISKPPPKLKQPTGPQVLIGGIKKVGSAA